MRIDRNVLVLLELVPCISAVVSRVLRLYLASQVDGKLGRWWQGRRVPDEAAWVADGLPILMRKQFIALDRTTVVSTFFYLIVLGFRQLNVLSLK